MAVDWLTVALESVTATEGWLGQTIESDAVGWCLEEKSAERRA